MYSGNTGFFREEVVVFGQKWLYSGKVAVFGQSGCIRAKWWYSGRNGCILAKCLYSAEVVLFGKNVCFLNKVDVFK